MAKPKPEPKRQRGRPLLGDVKRERMAALKMTDDELDMISSVAHTNNFNLAELIRAALTDYIKRKYNLRWPP